MPRHVHYISPIAPGDTYDWRYAATSSFNGVTDASGLFFLGLPWQHTRGSALIGFVNDDATFNAGRIDSHLEDPAGLVGTKRT
jgi:hypothetical protein